VVTPFLPRAMIQKEKSDPDYIANLILTDQFFGFIETDLVTPPHIRAKYEHLNFPPIVRRETVTADMLSEYQLERILATNRKLPVKTVVNAWSGKRLLMFSPYLKFLLKLGVKMVNIKMMVQYTPHRCFSTFINKCVQGRIDAKQNKTKADTFKVTYYS
jgi:hypothetical protein